MIKVRSLAIVLLILTTMLAFEVQAVESKPDLTASMRTNLNASVHDGEKIGRGQIFHQGEHVGFQVWLDAMKSGSAPERYVIRGRNNPSHELRVVLGQDGWVPDDKEGRGIIKLTSEPQAVFDIVADGNQTLEPDEYSVMIYGAYLFP
ncbi:MAG: AfaD family invasin [Hafnia sp.]